MKNNFNAKKMARENKIKINIVKNTKQNSIIDEKGKQYKQKKVH